jgi:hypothetical protein
MFIFGSFVIIPNLSSVSGTDLIIGDDESTYIISGDEEWENITVLTNGKLVVPSGTTLNATNIYLQGFSIVEINGGSLNLRNPNPAENVKFNGTCGYLNITNGAVISITGSNGYANTSSPGPYDTFINVSKGGEALFNVTISIGTTIENAIINITGGQGFDLPSSTNSNVNSWTYGSSLNSFEASGGNASFLLNVTNPSYGLKILNSTLQVKGNNGGKAADGGPSEWLYAMGGGYTNGGAVSGYVGVGGNALVSMSVIGGLIEIFNSNISINGGKGGDAGNGGYSSSSQGANGGGGGGYGGGDGGNQFKHGNNSGSVSDWVGSGGNASFIVDCSNLVLNKSILNSLAGNGGDAGNGGNGGVSGGGGGGGYGGGGGGGYGATSSTSHGGNTEVSGEVGRGGVSIINVQVFNNANITSSTIISKGGKGGEAGDGGVRGQGGGGGGGYGGGGGGGDTFSGGPGGNGGSTIVQDNIGSGGNAFLSINVIDNIISYLSTFTAYGGVGGNGGIGGSGSILIYSSGGGGGGYGGAGGGGDPSSNGGISQLIGNISDGGNAYCNIMSSDLMLSGKDAFQSIEGSGGFGPTSPGEKANGGDGLGRTTLNGTATLLIPMSRPILHSPENGNNLSSIPIIFDWYPVENSSSNGPLLNYILEIDDNPDFSSVIESNVIWLNNYSMSTYLPDGTYFWRVKAIYTSPVGSNAGWSDSWNFMLHKPPVPTLLTPLKDEHISGNYNLTALSDPDTVSASFYYYNDSWYYIGPGTYDSSWNTWYYMWNTSDLNLINKRIMVNATDNLGLYGSDTHSNIDIDNTPPSPIWVTPLDGEHLKGVYNLTTISDKDTIAIEFNYYDGEWHHIGQGQYDQLKSNWFYNWNTSHLDLINITISVNATDEVNLKGSSNIFDMEIDNIAPTPVFITPLNNEHISGIYNITVTSNNDTVLVQFYYYNEYFGSWLLIGEGNYDPITYKWYCNWITNNFDIANLNIIVKVTDEVGLKSNITVSNIEIDNTAPNPIILTPQNNENIKGIYNITAESDDDTTSIAFNYFDGIWHYIGPAQFDSVEGRWYYIWDTTGFDLKDILISANSTDEMGFWGNVSNNGIIIDSITPTIISVQPIDNSIDIPVNTDLTIEFSEPINIDNIQINMSISPLIDISSYEWNDNKTILTIILTSEFTQETEYTFSLNIDAEDLYGNSIDSTFSISFTTWLDTDSDGIMDKEDPDDDDDGIPDEKDYYPKDSTRWEEPMNWTNIIFILIAIIALIIILSLLITRKRKSTIKNEQIEEKSRKSDFPPKKSIEQRKDPKAKSKESQKPKKKKPNPSSPRKQTKKQFPPPPPPEDITNHNLPPPPPPKNEI